MMKKQFLIFLLAFGFTVSCSKGGGGEDTSDPIAEPAIDPPLAAALSFPVNNEVCESGESISSAYSRVTFRWSESDNTDFYTLNIQNLDNQSTQQFSNLTNTSRAVDLLKSTPYAWQVQSLQQGSTQAATSPRWRFYLAGNGTTNYPPYPANLLRPSSGNHFAAGTTSITLEWEGSDADDEPLTYTLYFDTFDGLQAPIESNRNLTQTSKQIVVQAASDYYWRIQTTDPNGNSSFSTVYSFRVE